MSRKTQRYSKEFKAEAVRTVPENQLSISEGASRLSLPEGTLGQWVTAARKGLGTPGSRTVAELESEILQLRFPIEAMCQVFGVSRSGYYNWVQHEPSDRKLFLVA
ncbi:IS600 ORF2 [Shigella sonnei]|nr:IS600 ORF2 [Shigella sonnei]